MRRLVPGLIFLTIVLSIWSSMHYFAWVQLARDTGLPASLQEGAAVLLAVCALSTLLSILRLVPRSFARPMWTAAFMWAGFIFLLDSALGVGELVRLGVHASGTAHDLLATDRLVNGGALLLAVGLALLAWQRALGDVPVKSVEVQLEKLPRELDGFSIVQVSDLHVSPDTDVRRIQRIVERVNEQQPDLIAVTGDLVDGSPELLKEGVAPLAGLKARHGAFFVTGNHEYYSGADQWLETVRALGIRPLQNERVQIGQGSHSFDLVGIPDLQGRSFGAHHVPQLEKALEGRDDSRETILLAHQPKQFAEAAKLGVGLQLSGHTHGGQIWPFTWLIHAAEKRVAGLHREGRSQLYVSRGTGFWGPPMRLGAPQEITRITLRRAG